MKPLSQKAAKVLEYIHQCNQEGIPPSVREICAALGIKSTSTVHKLLGELEEKSYIQRGAGLNRSLKLTGNSSARIPILGVVTAGAPVLAVEDIEGYVSYNTRGIPAGELFALRVKGESMINAGILDGDIIIAQRTPAVQNGEIVVALLGEESTVKRFYKEDGLFRLQPENDEMEPIYTNQLQILGKVVSSMRFYD